MNSLTNIHTAFDLAPYIHYPLSFMLLLIFFIKSPRTTFRNDDLFIYVVMFILCLVSYINGMSLGHIVNVKPLVITLMLVFLNSRRLPVIWYYRLFYFSIAFLVIEYIVVYAEIIPIFQKEYIRMYPLIRPIGPFMDMHLISYFIVFSVFIFNYRKISGLLSLVFGSYLISLGWIVFASKYVNKLFFMISMVALVSTLYAVGHLNIDKDAMSMLSILLTAFEHSIDYQCLTLGCSSNIDSTTADQRITDIGFYRVFYQYGLLWIVLLVISLRNYNKLFVFANIVMWVHYPFTLGILGFIIFIWMLHLIRYKEEQAFELTNQRLYSKNIQSHESPKL
jgi:hypothetical protein